MRKAEGSRGAAARRAQTPSSHGSRLVCASANIRAMTATTKTAVAKTTATKTTIAKTTATKTVKKPLSLKAQAAKRALVKRNRKAGSKKASLQAKKKGTGLFAPVNLSAELAAICGGKKMPRTQVSKKNVLKHLNQMIF